MPSKIKKFNFNGCQHLKKVLIDSGVEFEGKIDLSDTPITDKNNVYDTHVSFETPSPFKDIPNGITAKPEVLKTKIRLKSGTPIEDIQTDPEIINLKTPMSGWDKKAMELMNDNLFWYIDLKQSGRKAYLEQRREDLKNFLNKGAAADNLNQSVRILAEHLLLINEKILENADYFDEMGNIINPNMPSGTPQKKRWKDFHKFLTTEILKTGQGGLAYVLKSDNEIKPEIKSHLKVNLSDLTQKALDRFMNSLEATMDKDGSKYFTFADYDKDWIFEDYYNGETRNIGFKPTKKQGGGLQYNNNAISGTGEAVLTALFNYWNKDNFTPPPSTLPITPIFNSYEVKSFKQIYTQGSYNNWKDDTSDAYQLKLVLEEIDKELRTWQKYKTLDKIKEEN